MLLTPELSSSAGQLCCVDGSTAETSSSSRFSFSGAVAENRAPVISSVRTTEAPEQN